MDQTQASSTLDIRDDELLTHDTIDTPSGTDAAQTPAQLLEALRSIPKIRPIDYAREEVFHDEWGMSLAPDDVPVVESFEACTAPENRYIMSKLGDVRGLRVLDLGCGAGEAAVYFAMKGAQVTATDISAGMLRLTERVARRYGVRVECVQQNSDQLNFPDNSFDVVYAANLLHHVDLENCLDAACRILKPGGRFVSWDPLKHNPVINVYRRMAAAVRTEDERPLSIHDLRHFRTRFARVEHRCFWLASLWIFVRFFLIERVHPSKERYWKKIIVEAERLQGTYGRLASFDRLLLKLCPPLGRMCWNLAVVAQKPLKKERMARDDANSSSLRNE